MRAYQICKRCVSDTTIPSIRFNEQGICQFCESHDRLVQMYPEGLATQQKLNALIEKIKRDGQGKNYDCIVGVSGGTDSSYTLHVAKKLGLRPLAVHFDNGWNSDQAVTNIKRLTDKLDIDLYTYVVDWEEFKNLQISFLKASVPCIEAPTDVAIHAVLFRLAAEEGVKYILGGQSFRTEGTVPREWSYLDGTYVRSVQKKFGSVKLKSYPNLTLSQIFYYSFLKGIRPIPFLNYFDYRKKEAKELLFQEYGWQDYGGHHYENSYSRFAFGWYLPKKFGIDKRIISYSGPVRSGHMTREQALTALRDTPDVDQKLVDYCVHKLGLTQDQYRQLFALPARVYRDYFTSERILRWFKLPVRAAVALGIFTPVLYEKYFK